MSGGKEGGAASVEHTGLVLLVALLALAASAALIAGPPVEDQRGLAAAIGRKLVCSPRLPGPCWRDGLTLAWTPARRAGASARTTSSRRGGPLRASTRPGGLSLLPARELRRAVVARRPHGV